MEAMKRSLVAVVGIISVTFCAWVDVRYPSGVKVLDLVWPKVLELTLLYYGLKTLTDSGTASKVVGGIAAKIFGGLIRTPGEPKPDPPKTY